MTVPSARPRRIAHVLLLDRSLDRVLLSGKEDILSPPSVLLRPGQGYHKAAVEAARTWWGVDSLPIGRVTGHGWCGAPDQRTSERSLLMASLAHLPEPVRSNLPEGPAGCRWWQLADLRQHPGPTSPVDLHLIIEGYWDGWLPDGPLSVDWC
ncbi:hypothetical protein ACFWCB_14155 [Streptomyces sp. NPDC060048]|uniref:hypothetical protein n=1 Tax=Streptomyces TaxID=1883 RepID=UPI00365874FC